MSARFRSGHPRDDGEQMGGIHGLGDVLVVAGQKRLPAVVEGGVGGEGRGGDALEFPELLCSGARLGPAT